MPADSQKWEGIAGELDEALVSLGAKDRRAVVLRYLEWDFDDVWCGEHKEGFRAYCHPDTFKPTTPLVYHNDGNGHFTEIGQKIGVALLGAGAVRRRMARS